MKAQVTTNITTCVYEYGVDKATNDTTCTCFGVAEDECVVPKPPTPPPEPEDDDKSSAGVIIGIIVGGICLIAIIVLVIICCKKRGSSGSAQTEVAYDHGTDD